MLLWEGFAKANIPARAKASTPSKLKESYLFNFQDGLKYGLKR